MIKRSMHQPEREKLAPVPMLETLVFNDLVHEETFGAVRSVLRFVRPKDKDSGDLTRWLRNMWRTPVPPHFYERQN